MRLGEMLIARGLIEDEDLDKALDIQKERGEKIGKTLVDLGFVAMRDVLAALAEQLSLDLWSPDGPPPVSPETDGLAPRFLRQCRFMPVAIERLDADHRDGRPAGFRDAARRSRGSPGSQVAPVLAPSRRSWTPSTGTTARPRRKATDLDATPRRRPKTWSTCATWPARRRSSAW